MQSVIVAVEYVVFCKMSALQLTLYKHLLSSHLVKSCLHRSTTISPHLVCIGALRKLCNSPSFIYEAAQTSSATATAQVAGGEQQVRQDPRPLRCSTGVYVWGQWMTHCNGRGHVIHKRKIAWLMPDSTSTILPCVEMLRPAFIVSSLSYCSRALRVVWKDGVESVYPSTWLRSTVRDERFFNQSSLMYEPNHLSFASSSNAALKQAAVKNSKL